MTAPSDRFDLFAELLRALVASAAPSAPRNAAEHALAAAAAAFACWAAATAAPPRPAIGELVDWRRRCREAERERDDLRARLRAIEASHAQLPPSRRR